MLSGDVVSPRVSISDGLNISFRLLVEKKLFGLQRLRRWSSLHAPFETHTDAEPVQDPLSSDTRGPRDPLPRFDRHWSQLQVCPSENNAGTPTLHSPRGPISTGSEASKLPRASEQKDTMLLHLDFHA
ncbi:hypothetical protein AGIG_G25536 [Arapaima gigas]